MNKGGKRDESGSHHSNPDPPVPLPSPGHCGFAVPMPMMSERDGDEGGKLSLYYVGVLGIALSVTP